MADVSVRPARPDDAPEIGRIQVETWRSAYAEILPAAVLDGVTVEDAAATWSAAISEPPGPRHHVLVAQEQDWRVGFAALGPADDLEADDPEPATTLALAVILVEPRWGRRGHGSRLLAAAAEFFTEAGFTRAITWAPDTNAATTSFLESAGWARDGYARGLDTGTGVTLREIRFHTGL
jgi:GNAT superfamily N-acetyltransferase